MALRILMSIMTWLLWLVVGLVTLLLVVLFGLTLERFGLIFGPCGLLFLLLVIARSARLYRQSRGAMILNYLEQPIRLNLPIGPMLKASSASETGLLRWRLESLCQGINQGLSISESLRRYTPEVPSRTVALIGAAERIDRLPSVFARLIREQRHWCRRPLDMSAYANSYGLVLVIFLMFILGVLSVFIFPRYQEVFNDFDTPMPWITQVLFDFSLHFAIVILPVSIMLAIATAGWAIWEIFNGLLCLLRAGQLGKFIAARLPVSRGIMRDRALADACQLIEQAMIAGETLESAVVEASELRTSPTVRKKLSRLSELLHNGVPLGVAAKQARLPAMMTGMLTTANVSAKPAQTFEFLHRYYAQKFSRTAMILRSAALPIVVLVMGIVVGLVVTSLFLPIEALITQTNLQVEYY